MEFKYFCKGYRRLAIKYRYYTKYNIMILLSLVTPITIYIMERRNMLEATMIKRSSFILAVLLIGCFIFLCIGFLGFESVNAVRYQIFAITTKDEIVHFYFKEMLKDGKVILRFTPYKKRAIQNEYIEIVKRKEEIVRDEHFEEYLCTLCNDKQVEKQSDILFEVMKNPQIIKNKRRYIEIKYEVGEYGTEKKLKLYKSITNYNELLQAMLNSKHGKK